MQNLLLLTERNHAQKFREEKKSRLLSRLWRSVHDIQKYLKERMTKV